MLKFADAEYVFMNPNTAEAALQPEVFLGKGVLKICSKFTEEHPCLSANCKATLLKSHFDMGVLL